MNTKLIALSLFGLVAGVGISNVSAHQAVGDQYKKDYVSHVELTKELQAFYEAKQAEEVAAARATQERVAQAMKKAQEEQRREFRSSRGGRNL